MKIDREKWDRRYDNDDFRVPAPDPLLVAHRDLLTSGRALDLASGYGAGSLFVAHLGYKVHAVDISFRVLSSLQREAASEGLPVLCVVGDLDTFPLPRAFYDLVMVFSFFSIPLMSSIKECLRDDGLLFYSTFNCRHTTVKPGFNPTYLVPAGGLAPFFPDFDIIVDEPATGDEKNLSRLIARK